MRRSELVRRLATVPPFPAPAAASEQVATPPELAVDLLEEALARDDLVGRSVLDLGSGTGVLALGAALLGAEPVTGVEADARAVAVARAAAADLGVAVTWIVGPVGAARTPAATVVMNPPFGAQRAHADRPFWDAAFALARRRVHAFGLRAARTFIAARAVERGARIEATRPVRWPLPATFPHHRERRRELAVDRWVLSVGEER